MVVPISLLHDFFRAIGFHPAPGDIGTVVRQQDGFMYFFYVANGTVDLDDVLEDIRRWEGDDGVLAFLHSASEILEARLQGLEETDE